MSVCRNQTTDMNDQVCLKKAIEKLGPKYKVTEQAKAKIRGHGSEMSQEGCEMVVRKEDSGRKADIGFCKGADGNFSVVTDTWVNSDINLKDFAGTLKVNYVQEKAKAIARKEGFSPLGVRTLPNGSVQMRFSAR